MSMFPKELAAAPAIGAISLVLTACATPEKPPATPAVQSEAVATPNTPAKQPTFKLASGTYRCELGKKVEVQRDARNPDQMKLTWQGIAYSLQRYDSTSGLPRYEDRKNGLVWLDLPWKGILMDTKNGHPLANECKTAS